MFGQGYRPRATTPSPATPAPTGLTPEEQAQNAEPTTERDKLDKHLTEQNATQTREPNA